MFAYISSAAMAQSRLETEAAMDLWQLYLQSRLSDPRILSAEAQIRSGAGEQRAALGQMLPQLSANSAYSKVRRVEQGLQGPRPDNEAFSGETYTLSLSQAIYNPAAWRSFKKYSELTEQYRSQYDDVKIQSAVDLVQRYFAALAAEDELELAIAERKTTQRNLDRAKALFDRQLATITDVLQISARVDSLKTAEIEAKSNSGHSRVPC
ncbi:TolC family protein [Pseudomonas asuensis]